RQMMPGKGETNAAWMSRRYPKPTEWPTGADELFAWFATAKLPQRPFQLAVYLTITDPPKHYEWIRAEIKRGPNGGYQDASLLGHLKMLQSYVFEHPGE